MFERKGENLDNLISVSEKLEGLSEKKIGKIRENIDRLLLLKEELVEKHGKKLMNLNDEYPIFNILNNFEDIGKKLGRNNEKLSDDEIKKMIDKYNENIKKFNNLKNQLRKSEEEKFEGVKKVINGEGDFGIEEEKVTEKEKEELKKFAKALWNEFFPESYVDRFVKDFNNQEELEDYQKILLAPANGVENIIMGVARLFNSKSYKELYNSIDTLTNLNYNDWCNLWKALSIAYENIDETDKITPIISFIFSIGFLLGGISKITELAEKLNISKKMINALKITGNIGNAKLSVENSAKTALLGTISGITLQTINLGK